MPLVLLFRGPPPLSFPVHPPRTNRDAEHARQQGDVVRALVAPDPHLAGAVAVGLQWLLGRDERPPRDELVALGEPWRPYRSTAARLVWHYYLQVAPERRRAKPAR